MNLNAAAIFVRVVEAHGFSAAGRLLGVPKTTVSKKVADLEAQLGVRLLNRTTRRISVTEAGERVYDHCVAALRHMEEAEREALALRTAPEGMLTIAAPSAIGVPFLLPIIADFMALHPLVQVTLLSSNALPDFEHDRIDVMIWAGASTASGHAVRLVAEVEIALYASAAYLTRQGAPQTPAELAHHHSVVVMQSLVGGRYIWPLERDGQRIEVAPAVPPRFRSNDPMAAFSAIAAGFGIGGLPVQLVRRLPEGAALTPVLPDWRISPIELSALYRDASSLKIRLFIDFVADWFRRY